MPATPAGAITAHLHSRILSAISQGLVVHAPDGSIIECNAAAETILGLTRDQITGRTSLDPRWRTIRENGTPFPGETHPAMITLQTGQSVHGTVMGVSQPDDSLRWIEICSEPLTDTEGRLEAVVVTFTDITDKRQMAQSLLLASQQFAQATLDSMDAQVCVINHEGRVVSVNTAWRECTLRYATDQTAILEGGDYLDLCERTATPDQPVLIQLLDGLRDILSGQRNRFQMEYDYIGSGRQHWYYSEISSFSAAGDIFHMVLHKDITEHRTMAARLAQTQKLESLGLLAGGVAHDMNNVLAAILGLSTALREQPGDADATASALDTIINASQRGSEVVQRLLYFAHRTPGKTAPVHPDALVTEVVQLLGATLLKHCDIRMELQQPLPAIDGDAGALVQVLVNLCINAADAMPDGGSIVLRTWQEGDTVAISVKDDGCGMPEDVAARAIEPFFTTKPVGKGTGLGLPMVYGITAAHGGQVVLDSTPGRGTEVTLRFPAGRFDAEATADSHPASRSAAPTASTANENKNKNGTEENAHYRILLVDDEAIVRDSVTALLEVLGHSVCCAGSGAEALDLLAQAVPFDLLILDRIMPGMHGNQLLQQILSRWPQQHVLMASGYSEQAGADAVHPRVASISKPFGLPTLRDAIAALLPAKPAPA